MVYCVVVHCLRHFLPNDEHFLLENEKQEQTKIIDECIEILPVLIKLVK